MPATVAPAVLAVVRWTLWGEQLLRGRGGVSEEDLRVLLANEEHARRDRLLLLISQAEMEGVEPRIELAKGEARRLLGKLVRKAEIDLLVLGTVSRTGLPNVIIGNTAEVLLNTLPCSVLAVKPDGFVSPALAKGQRMELV